MSTRKQITTFAAVLPVFGVLAGCLNYSGGDSIKALPADIAASAHVGSIVIRDVPSDVSPEFKPELEAELRKKMDVCAKGEIALSLEVSISEVKKQNVALTLLVGNSNGIKGTARLMRPDTGEVVGDYDISHSLGAGGVVATVGLSGAETRNASAFADDLCARAFPVRHR
jgi:hypothetical protein